MDTDKMIIIPLAIMFLLTIAGIGVAPGITDDPFQDRGDTVGFERPDLTTEAVDNIYEYYETDWWSEYGDDLPLSDPWWRTHTERTQADYELWNVINNELIGENWPDKLDYEYSELFDKYTHVQMYSDEYSELYGNLKIAEQIIDETEDENALIDPVRFNEQIAQDPGMITEYEEIEGFQFEIDSTAMFIGVIFSFMLFVGVVGINLFGAGLSEISVLYIVKFTAYMTMWGLLSFASLGLIQEIPIVGGIIWTLLTLVYTLGVILKGELA